MRSYNVIGIMSGSSMDGVDLAHCRLWSEGNHWKYEITHAETVPYDEKWRVRLSQLRGQNSLVLTKTDIYYGRYLGQLVNDFVSRNNLKPDLIGSHGHTVFHYPEEWISLQVGDGASLSGITNLPVVSQFRQLDVAKGGEGAPLVAIGDEMLFSEYDYCLNLGGFSNISGILNGKRIAWDICPCNILLNRVARDMGLAYDEDGRIAEAGHIDYPLLGDLNEIPWYTKPWPKSLNRDWINKELWNIVREVRDISNENRMKTLVDHIACQIGDAVDALSDGNAAGKRVLVTGGGAFNKALMEHIRTHSDAEFIVPEPILVNYKEALVFALMAALRVLNLVNIRKETTGASSNSVAGALHGDFSEMLG